MEIGLQHFESDVAEARQKQGLRFLETVRKGGVDRLFDQAVGRLHPVADRKQRGIADGVMEVAQRDLLEIAGERPAAAMSLLGSNKAALAQAGHNPSDNDGVCLHRAGEGFGCRRALMFGHMQQNVEDARKAAVSFHVTIIVT